MIWRAAAFSGVEVYTYAIMDNHFHLLVRGAAGRSRPNSVEAEKGA